MSPGHARRLCAVYQQPNIAICNQRNIWTLPRPATALDELKAKRGHHRGGERRAAGAAALDSRRAGVGRSSPTAADEMRVGCGADLAGRNMRAYVTICPKRLAGSVHVDPRRRNSKVKRGCPQGPRMKCGWGCGSELTAARCARTSRHARSGRQAPTKYADRGGECCAAGATEPGAPSPVAGIARNPRWGLSYLPNRHFAGLSESLLRSGRFSLRYPARWRRAWLTWSHLADLNLQLDIGVVWDVAEDLRPMLCYRVLELLNRIEVEPANAGEGRR